MDTKIQEVDRLIVNTFKVRNCGALGGYAATIVASDFELLKIGGLVITRDATATYTFADDAPRATDGHPYTADDAADWNGEWLGLFINRLTGQMLVMLDHAGHAKAYTAFRSDRFGKTTAYISQSFRGLSSMLHSDGYPPTVNWNLVIPHLLSRVNMFRNRLSRQLFINGSEALSNREALLIGESGSAVVERPLPHALRNPDARSYEEWIYQAAERTADEFRAVTSFGGPGVLSLSGGKDSRNVLAMLFAGGISADEFTIRSERPGDRLGAVAEVFNHDLVLASKLVDHFGLEWEDPGEEQFHDISFLGSLMDYQDARSGENFEFLEKHRLLRGQNITLVTGGSGERLRVATGESYAKAFPSWNKAAKHEIDSVSADLAQFLEIVAPRRNLNAVAYDHVKESFVAQFRHADNVPVKGQFDGWMLTLRERSHTGNCMWRLQEGTTQLLPLEHPELLAANELIALQERPGGRLAFDITDILLPELHALPYQSGAWPPDFRQRRIDPYWHAQWEKASVERATVRWAQNPKRTDHRSRFYDPARTEEYFRSARARLVDNVEMLIADSPDPEGLSERIARRSLISKEALLEVVAVMESVRDVVEDTHPPLVEYDYDLATRQDSVRRRGTQQLHAGSFNALLNNLDLSGVTAQARIEDGSLVIDLQALPTAAVAAFYGYAEGVRIHATGYEAGGTARRIPLEQGAHPDRVTVFLKWENDSEALAIFDVEVKTAA